MTIEETIGEIKRIIFNEKRMMVEFNSLSNYLHNTEDDREREMINGQMSRLQESLKKMNGELLEKLESIDLPSQIEKPKEVPIQKVKIKKPKEFEKLPEIDREILKRLKGKKKKAVKIEIKKPSPYARLASQLFANKVRDLIKEKRLTVLEKDLIKSNINYTPISYISMLILTTIVAGFAGIILFVFFFLFNVSATFPLVTRATEAFGIRFLKVFWILIIAPLATGIFMYFYPSLEKKSAADKIDQELPFATIHMAAISGAMIEPVNVFKIISATKEYPHLEKEFNKLLNEINIYGYDLVTALKSVASNSPSPKLAEIFNGLAMTITSGGSLYNFFEKRAENLLFSYRLDREKRTKSAETFMDIYISVVIAAPMILMLLLMMMKISGLGLSLSTSTITLLIIGAVSLINTIFLVFLQLKQPEAI
jgi:hypothetical protein